MSRKAEVRAAVREEATKLVDAIAEKDQNYSATEIMQRAAVAMLEMPPSDNPLTLAVLAAESRALAYPEIEPLSDTSVELTAMLTPDVILITAISGYLTRIYLKRLGREQEFDDLIQETADQMQMAADEKTGMYL